MSILLTLILLNQVQTKDHANFFFVQDEDKVLLEMGILQKYVNLYKIQLKTTV